jgi:hypothetical protein
MTEAPLLLVLLGVIAACAVTATACILTTARDLRAALRRLHTVLPEAEGTLRETRHALRQARRLLARGDNASRHVEAVVLRACEAASEALERLGRMRAAAAHLFHARTRNGAGAEPRPNHRRGS